MAKKMILGALGLAALLVGLDYGTRKPLEFTDTLRGISAEKSEGQYVVRFENNAVGVDYSPFMVVNPITCNEYKVGSKYHVSGYENIFRKKANTVEAVN